MSYVNTIIVGSKKQSIQMLDTISKNSFEYWGFHFCYVSIFFNFYFLNVHRVSVGNQLRKTKSFKDIRFKDIADNTSFTRTSIYNYYKTKEEIFLALFEREYQDFHEDLLRRLLKKIL